MKVKPYIIVWIIFLSMLLCLSASARVIDRIVAIVNDDIITLVDLNQKCAPYLVKLSSGAYTKEQQDKMTQDVQGKMLDRLVEDSLTRQEAKRYRIEVSKKEIDNAINNMMEAKSLSKDELEKALASDNMTMALYRDSIRAQILRSRIINQAVKSKVVVTDSEIKAYYEENTAAYAGVKKYHLRHILITDQQEVGGVLSRLENGEDFAKLAGQYSKSPNSKDGGDLGEFDISSFSQNIKHSIEKLEEGQYTNALSTAQGYQIFYVQDIVMDGYKTLEQAKDEIHELLYRQQVEKKFESWIKSLKNQAHIELKL